MEPAAPVCQTFRPLFSRGFRLKTGMPAPPKKKKNKSETKQGKKKNRGNQRENKKKTRATVKSRPDRRRKSGAKPWASRPIFCRRLFWVRPERKKSGYFINRFLVCKSRRSKSAAPSQPRFVSGPSRHRARRPARARAKLLGGERGVCRGGKQKSGPAGLKRAPSVNAR